jgi:hypothetical protein
LILLKQYLKLEDSDLEKIETNKLSGFIFEKIQESDLDSNKKKQLTQRANVSYHNLIELKELLKMDNDPKILISSYETNISNKNRGGAKRKPNRKSHKKKTRRHRRKSVRRNRRR